MMDVETGEVKQMEEVEYKTINVDRAVMGKPQLVRLARQAKSDCSKCYGKGFTGINIDTGLHQVCKCTLGSKADFGHKEKQNDV